MYVKNQGCSRREVSKYQRRRSRNSYTFAVNKVVDKKKKKPGGGREVLSSESTFSSICLPDKDLTLAC